MCAAVIEGFGACNAVLPSSTVEIVVGCSSDHTTTIVVDLIVAFALLYFAITYLLLLLRLRGYRKQPYTFVQVGLVYTTLQVCLCILTRTRATRTDSCSFTTACIDSCLTHPLQQHAVTHPRLVDYAHRALAHALTDTYNPLSRSMH